MTATPGVWCQATEDANAVLERWLTGVDAEKFETWLDRTTGSNLPHLCRRRRRLETYGRLRAVMLGLYILVAPPLRRITRGVGERFTPSSRSLIAP